MSEPIIVPICITVPTGLLSSGMVKLPMFANAAVQSSRLLRVDGHLRALTLGPYVVSLKSMHDGRTLATLTWNAAGLQFATGLDPTNSTLDATDDGLQIDTSGSAVAPQDCYLVMWWLINL